MILQLQCADVTLDQSFLHTAYFVHTTSDVHPFEWIIKQSIVSTVVYAYLQDNKV